MKAKNIISKLIVVGFFLSTPLAQAWQWSDIFTVNRGLIAASGVLMFYCGKQVYNTHKNKDAIKEDIKEAIEEELKQYYTQYHKQKQKFFMDIHLNACANKVYNEIIEYQVITFIFAAACVGTFFAYEICFQ